MAIEELTGRSRVTVFPLEGLTVAYTTQSSDSRGLGDVAIMALTGPDSAQDSRRLWQLAADMLGERKGRQDAAKWLLIQCLRARMTNAPAHQEHVDAAWAAVLDTEVRLACLYANHERLRTGCLTLVGQAIPAAGASEPKAARGFLVPTSTL
ncbi:hypothetical protein [Streptomyces sp. SYSU K21746]